MEHSTFDVWGLLISKTKVTCLKNLHFQDHVNSFTQVNDAVEQQLRKLFNKKSNFQENIVYKSLKRFHDLCMDKGKEIEKSI